MDGVDRANSDLFRRHCLRSAGYDRLADRCTEPRTPRLLADSYDTGRSTVRRPDGERLLASRMDWVGRAQLVDRVRRVPNLVGGGYALGLSKHEYDVPARRCYRPSHRRQEPGKPGETNRRPEEGDTENE